MSLSLQHMIREISKEQPDTIALTCGERHVSYRELDRESNRFARLLNSAGCEKGDRVCLLMDKSIEAVVSLLGSVKAGAIYVPITPEIGVERFENILKASRVSWIIANTECKHLFKVQKQLQDAGERVGFGWMGSVEEFEFYDMSQSEGACCVNQPEFISRNLEEHSPEPVPVESMPSDPLYIQFNQRKDQPELDGIVFTHENIMNCAEWMVNHFGIKANDRVCSTIPLHFAHSCFDLFGTLLAGASLVMVENRVINKPDLLIRFLTDQNITHGIVFPTVLKFAAKEKSLSAYEFQHLRHLIFWDKISARNVIDYCMSNLKNTTITNLYSALKSADYLNPEDFSGYINGDTARPGWMNGVNISEKVFVFGDDLAPLTDHDVNMIRLKHLELKLKCWKTSINLNGGRENIPNPFSLEFYN
jgi:non-ribosomal peptide synthetase component F